MKHHRFLLSCAVLLWAVSPGTQGANRKARPTQKEHTAKAAPATQKEDFQKNVEQEIASLKEDVYTRATWKKLQEVKQEADDTASTLRLAALSSAGAGFVLGCVVTIVAVKRMRKSEENLRIT